MKQYLAAIVGAGLFILLGVVGCNSTSQAKTADRNDLEKTEGTWTLVSAEVDGKPLSDEIVKNSQLTIIGDKYTVKLGDSEIKRGIQKLDATKTPKEINARDTEGPTVGENLGIYEFLPNGEFRVCFAATGKPRPTQFESTADNGQFIHVWRRAK